MSKVCLTTTAWSREILFVLHRSEPERRAGPSVSRSASSLPSTFTNKKTNKEHIFAQMSTA